MYFQLAAKVAVATDLLIEAQQQGETTYIESEDAVLTLLPESKDKNKPPEPKWVLSVYTVFQYPKYVKIIFLTNE